MADPRIIVRDSPVHGRGVFALESIPAGTIVLEYLGERISRREAARREEADVSGVTYVLEYDEDGLIDGAVGGNEARFINHSCEPNCGILREGGRAFIRSVADIAPGDELSFDYAFDRDGPEVACRCAAAGCRGVLNES